MTTTADLLLQWDRLRPRSQQRELGMSEVGDCRRRAGYRLAGVEPSNPSGSIQAVLGTAIHAAVEQVYRDLQQQGLIPADDLVEHEVEFAGVRGHLDRYGSATGDVEDSKSTTARWLAHLRLHGAERHHVWQGHLYGAGLIRQGYPVRRIVIDYIARDTGEDWQETMPFDPQHVRDALDWLAFVRDTPLDLLPRDHAPTSAFCRHCPFQRTCWDGGVPDRDPRSVLYLDHPDAQAWARQLDEARADKADAERREEEARGALDAIRPNTSGTSDVVDVGYPKGLRWTVNAERRLDIPAVRVKYETAGVKPPEKTITKTTLKLVPLPQDGASS
jgi:hypothetical protein